MQLFIKMYFAALVPFALLDATWISFIARGFYERQIGFVINTFKVPPAIAFYIIYVLGIVYFAVRPTAGEPLLKTFLAGALFGLCAYASYDLTNQATIAGWPTAVTLADMAWGAFASGTAATVAGFLTRA